MNRLLELLTSSFFRRSYEVCMNEIGSRDPDPLNHAPDKSKVALLLIDVINDLEFDGGEKLLPHAIPMAASLAALKRRAKAAGIPAIYSNDNFGRWRSDFRRLVQHCLEDNVRGKQIVAQISARGGRLFRPQAETFSFLSHESRYSCSIISAPGL